MKEKKRERERERKYIGEIFYVRTSWQRSYGIRPTGSVADVLDTLKVRPSPRALTLMSYAIGRRCIIASIVKTRISSIGVLQVIIGGNTAVHCIFDTSIV